jgi:hypothetical protein
LAQDFDEKGFLGLQAQEFCAEISKRYREWFDLCSDINSFGQKSKYEMNIHNMDGQEVISVCLFLKILNGFQACLILAKYGLVAEAEVLLRSLFEALFIMKACINDEDFTREYVKSDEAKQLKLMKAAYKHDAPIFLETRKYASIGRMKELQEKKDRKEIKELNVFDVAEKAGLGILYDSAYRLLSDSVHCGPKSLEDYIAGTDDVGRVKSLTVMPIKAELENVFINAAQVMFYALGFIFEFFQIDKKNEMEPLDLRFQKLMGVPPNA